MTEKLKYLILGSLARIQRSLELWAESCIAQAALVRIQ